MNTRSSSSKRAAYHADDFAEAGVGRGLESRLDAGVGKGVPVGCLQSPKGNSGTILSWIPTSLTLAATLLTAVIYAIPCQAQSYNAAAQQRNSDKGLWVCNFGFFSEFQGAGLQKSGRSNATLALTFAEGGSFPDLTFDKAGNLWLAFVADQGSGVGELTRNELATGKKGLRFSVLLSYIDADPNPLFSPLSLAFDPAGDLWVASIARTAGTLPYSLVEYTPDQLTASGGPTPASTITFANGSGIVPSLVRFDSAGDLWLAYQFSQSDPSPAVLEYTPVQIAELQNGGSPMPAITVVAGSLKISAIAFDKQGNLWIAASNEGGNPNGVDGGTVEMFQVAGKSGTLSEPEVTVTPAPVSSINQSLDQPSGLAFDGSGSLWVSNRLSSDQISGSRNTSGFLVKFAANQLTASGSPVPPTVISPNRKATNLQNPTSVIFGPIIK
jgi:hypothetical protein